MKKLLIILALAAMPLLAQQSVTLDLGAIELSRDDVKILLASPSIQNDVDPDPNDGTPATRAQVAQFLRSETRRVLKHYLSKARAEAEEANADALPTDYKSLVDQINALRAQIKALREADPTEN